MMKKKRYLDLFEKYIANKATNEEVEYLLLYIRKNSQLNTWFEEQIINSPSNINEEFKQEMFKQVKAAISSTEKAKKTSRFSWNKLIRVAATFFLPFLIAYGGLHYYNIYQETKAEPLIVTAGYGEKANVTLPDGSRVWLNSDSKLTYCKSYNKSKRKLRLSGEAFFEVVHNAKKDFIVECMDIEVIVLGTTFNVKAYDEDSIATIVLVQGKVKVATPSQSLILKPNERITYNKSEKKVLSELVDANLFVGWRESRLRFENESLQDIAKTISRMHNIDYIFSDEIVKDIRFTGTVDNTSVESVLNSIILTSPISYSIKDSVIIFSKDLQKKIYFED